MPSINDLKQKILNSQADDWQAFDGERVFVYKPDTDLRIEQADGDLPYNHPWTHDYPHEDNVRQISYTIYYRQSPIDSFNAVFIDGGRLHFPNPHCAPSDPTRAQENGYDEISVSRYHATIGRILSMESFDRRIQTAEITIRDEDF